MADDPRDERARLRRERLAAERTSASSSRRRDLLGYIGGGALAAVVVIGIVVAVSSGGGAGQDEEAGAVGDCDNAAIRAATGSAEGLRCDDREGTDPPPVRAADPEESAAVAGCDYRADLAEEGAEHVEAEEEPKYKTRPPTSGNMYEMTIADGAFVSTPPQPSVLHSLEHGRIAFQYDPDALSEEEELTIKGVFDELPFFALLFPNRDMPYAVAATAWTNLVGCPEWNERVPDVLRAFREEFRDQAPESPGI